MGLTAREMQKYKANLSKIFANIIFTYKIKILINGIRIKSE
tara:strand:+ start:322 stop:444 length:123 start_codon:yes stop_codon:yes gene_type:complete